MNLVLHVYRMQKKEWDYASLVLSTQLLIKVGSKLVPERLIILFGDVQTSRALRIKWPGLKAQPATYQRHDLGQVSWAPLPTIVRIDLGQPCGPLLLVGSEETWGSPGLSQHSEMSGVVLCPVSEPAEQPFLTVSRRVNNIMEWPRAVLPWAQCPFPTGGHARRALKV